MAKKKHLRTIYDKDGPWDFIKKFNDSQSKISEYAMKRIAYEIVRRAKAHVRNGTGYDESGKRWEPLYYAGPEVGQSTIKWNDEWRKESRDRNIPLYDTGALADSIKVFTISTNPKGSFATIGSNLPYAHLQEFGGPNPLPGHNPIPARPYITPAMIEVKFGNAFKRQLKREIKKIYLDMLTNGGKPVIPTLERPQ